MFGNCFLNRGLTSEVSAQAELWGLEADKAVRYLRLGGVMEILLS